jgi:hydrogenase maturation protein HypF
MRLHIDRRVLFVHGVVQGVGFRPFVHALASRYGLTGFVRNRVGDVIIEVQGAPAALDDFVGALQPPAPARVDAVECSAIAVRAEEGFRIEASDEAAGAGVTIAADVAPCDDCLREMLDPRDRRYLYPFVNCARCGPRLTIMSGAPYDRARTTMAGFAMCDDCRREYDDPRDRRFHAQPNACARCGPRLLTPLEDFARSILDGKIGALKGLGGYHLVCDARAENVVAELRRRKQRDGKPFALMVADVAAARALCDIDDEARLTSPARPIVLCARRDDGPIAPSVAPGLRELGLMLPPSPLHHLLARACAIPLVMTSGNLSHEPIAFDDADARARLAPIADVFLVHDRPILAPLDDSVVRGPTILRRARGFAPLPLTLSRPLATPTLAVGGHMKAAFALGDGRRATLSQHLGELEYAAAQRAWTDAVARYQEIFRVRPRRLAHDLHPDYASTRWALEQEDVTLLAVQHHHAHLASVLCEHNFSGRAVGVCFDGTGLGSDGALWGGEFLVGNAKSFTRAAHLAYVPLPGGERAIREPWRMAAAHLHAAGLSLAPVADQPGLMMVEQLLERRVNAPPTSSMGRLFDAVAALLGICTHASFDGQAPMRLEALAATVPREEAYPVVVDGDRIQAPMEELVQDSRQLDAARVARRFHSWVVDMIVAVATRLARQHQLDTVAFSGGVFANRIVSAEAAERLSPLTVLQHRLVPPNDGGLALGQLAVAAAGDDV